MGPGSSFFSLKLTTSILHEYRSFCLEQKSHWILMGISVYYMSKKSIIVNYIDIMSQA